MCIRDRGNGGSHCGLRDVGHGVWVTICGYVTGCVMVRFRTILLMRYGGALRRVTAVRYVDALRCVTLACYGSVLWCVTVRYGYVTMSYASPCSKLGLRFHMRIGKTLHVVFDVANQQSVFS